MKNLHKADVPQSALRSVYIDLTNRINTFLRYCYNRNALSLQKQYPQFDLPASDADVRYINTIWYGKSSISLFIIYYDGEAKVRKRTITLSPEKFFCED